MACVDRASSAEVSAVAVLGPGLVANKEKRVTIKIGEAQKTCLYRRARKTLQVVVRTDGAQMLSVASRGRRGAHLVVYWH